MTPPSPNDPNADEFLSISLDLMRGLIRTHDLKIPTVDTEAFLFKFKKLKWNEPKFGLKN